MIPMEDAVKSAFEHLQNLYPSNGYSDPFLEEVELTDDSKAWAVTVSFNTVELVPITTLDEMLEAARMKEAGSPLPSVLRPRDENAKKKRVSRKYKVLKIDAENGQLQALKFKN